MCYAEHSIYRYQMLKCLDSAYLSCMDEIQTH